MIITLIITCLVALIAACLVFHWNESDPAYIIHKRQQRLLRNHSKAMKIWKKRAKIIKPNREWTA